MSGVQGVTWGQFDDDPEVQEWIDAVASYGSGPSAKIGKAILATKPAPPRVLQVGDVLRGGWTVIGLNESPGGWVATVWAADIPSTYTQRSYPSGLPLVDGSLAVWPDGGAS